MSKRTWNKTRRDAKDLTRNAKVGDTYYGAVDVSRTVAPYENSQLANRWTVTHMNGVLGGPMVGSSSLESLLYQHGPLTTQKPPNLRGLWEPAPQVAGPVDPTQTHLLDEVELRGLEKQVRQADDERRKTKRKGRWL